MRYKGTYGKQEDPLKEEDMTTTSIRMIDIGSDVEEVRNRGEKREKGKNDELNWYEFDAPAAQSSQYIYIYIYHIYIFILIFRKNSEQILEPEIIQEEN